MENTTLKGQSDLVPPARPLLFILSGPSGVGKDAVLHRIKESSFPLKYVVTMTTRPRRKRETDKVDYNFISMEEFQKMVEGRKLLEWANVYGNMYGVPRDEVEQALEQGQDVMVKVDIQGVANIKKIMPESISIFLMPHSPEDLVERLNQRHTESPSALDLRIKTATEEMKQVSQFDYAVMNRRGQIDLAVADIKAIITAEKCRVNPR
jgi:guanylate kinase